MFIVKVGNKFFNDSTFPSIKLVEDIKDATKIGSIYAANQFVEELRKKDYENVYPESVRNN